MTTQTKTTHTPGPWEVNGNEVTTPLVKGRSYRRIASVQGYGMADNEINDTNQANARLIASAPNLLDSLRDILEMVTDNRLHGEEVYRAANAIRKAEGRI